MFRFRIFGCKIKSFVKLLVMYDIFDTLSNREIAWAGWSLALLAFVLSNKPLRKIIWGTLNVLAVPTILIVGLLFLDYVLVIIDILQRIGFWNTSLTKDTLLWLLGSGLVLMFNAPTVRDTGHFKRNVLDMVKMMIVLEFIVNFYTFSLLTEIILQPILVFILWLKTIADIKPEHKIARGPLNFIISAFGIGVLLLSIYQTFLNPTILFTAINLKFLILPAILTILTLPFIYFLTLYANYESLFIRLRFLEKEHNYRKALMWEIIKVANLNLKKLSNISSGIAKLLLIEQSRSLSDIQRISNGNDALKLQSYV